MNRRSFAESMAVAALAPVLGMPAQALHGIGAAVEVEREDLATLALALVEILRLEYGHALTVPELRAITRQIQAGLDRADLIRRAEAGREG